MAEIMHNTFQEPEIIYGNPVGDNSYMLCVDKDAEIVFFTRNELKTMLDSVEDMMRINDFEQPDSAPELTERMRNT